MRVAVINVDPPELSRSEARREGFTFALLSDPGARTIRRYDLLHPGAGPDGQDISRPAEFLVDREGTVRWVNLTDSIIVRARPESVLRAIDQALSPTTTSR